MVLELPGTREPARGTGRLAGMHRWVTLRRAITILKRPFNLLHRLVILIHDRPLLHRLLVVPLQLADEALLLRALRGDRLACVARRLVFLSDELHILLIEAVLQRAVCHFSIDQLVLII